MNEVVRFKPLLRRAADALAVVLESSSDLRGRGHSVNEVVRVSCRCGTDALAAVLILGCAVSMSRATCDASASSLEATLDTDDTDDCTLIWPVAYADG